MECSAGQKNLPALLLFFAHIKPQAPCVQNNVHCICHSMGGRSTIKTPFLTGAQVEMLIRELKKKHV